MTMTNTHKQGKGREEKVYGLSTVGEMKFMLDKIGKEESCRCGEVGEYAPDEIVWCPVHNANPS